MKISKLQLSAEKISSLLTGNYFLNFFRRSLLLSPLIFSLLIVPLVYAAPAGTAPDAGQILQQIERDIEVRPVGPLPEFEAEPVPVDEGQGPLITVKQFIFIGNRMLSDEVLQAAVAPLLNRSITVAELKTSLNLITALYRKYGYLVTATWPEQDITEGVVQIKIVEAVLGDIKFDGSYGKDFKRVKPQVFERYIQSAVPKAQVLNQDKLGEGLALLGSLSGVDVEGSLQAGSDEGTTDVLLKVKDQPLLSGYVLLDNSNGRQTGRDKVTATLAVASPAGYGDNLSATALHSEGTDYLRLAYKLPVGASGLQIGVNASTMYYRVTTAEYSASKLSGQSDTLGLQAQYPLLRNKTSKLNISLELDQKYFTNKGDEGGLVVTTSDYKLRVASLSLSGDHTDAWLAGAQNNAAINISAGRVDMDGSRAQHREGDRLGAQTQGDYLRLRWNLSRNQFLTNSISLNLSGSGQFANSNLDSSEKFYLGGINGVRAYPTSEGAGSEGLLFGAELFKYLPNNLTLSAFIDHGLIKQYL
ncbi:ShlB/FhaC/HecB family hemolysin secretion/activation protein, partial [bacterium]|nr:ShlB/FhaC/HecB family hemolysin secretion/activation protein [bacterium]